MFNLLYQYGLGPICHRTRRRHLNGNAPGPADEDAVLQSPLTAAPVNSVLDTSANTAPRPVLLKTIEIRFTCG